MPRIDLHTHLLPPPSDWPNLTEKFGYPGWIGLESIVTGANPRRANMTRTSPGGSKSVFREVGSNVWDPAARLGEMDGHGIDAQVLSTVPVMFSYWARPQDTLEVSRWLNDHLAQVVGAHADRFVGLGTIPMNAPAFAVKELERCVRELGMPGVQIGTNVRGLDLGDPSLREIFAAAQELDACIFVHPWEMLQDPTPATPDAPTTPPAPPAIPARLQSNWMAWLVGMPAETGLAVCSILFSGLLDRYPRLRIGFAHGGGCFPGCLGRIDHGFHARPDLCQTQSRTPPRDYLLQEDKPGTRRPARFYADSLVHDADALERLIKLLGSERVALGSDYPFPLGEERPGALIDSMTNLSGQTCEDLLFRTALDFLGPRAGRLRCAKPAARSVPR